MSAAPGRERWTVADIRTANAEAGFYFFERKTMRFFDSRVCSGAYDAGSTVLFVTSEQFHGSHGSAPREWTVREFLKDSCEVNTARNAEGFQMSGFRNLAEARQAARLEAKLRREAL